MKKELFIILIFGFGILFSGLSISDVSISPNELTPGAYATVTATISSVLTVSSSGSVLGGGDTVKDTEVSSYSYGGLDYTPNSISIGDLDPGASTEISIPIKISNDAKSGSYLFKIKAKGLVEGSTGASTSNDKSATVSLNVINKPILSFETKNNIIGEHENILLNIKNDGGNAKDLRIKVIGDFAIEGKDQIYVGEVDKQKNISFVLDSTDSEPGINNVEFKLDYYDEFGIERNETKKVRFNVVKDDSVVKISQDGEIISSVESNLLLRIQNSNKSINDLKISFENSDLKLVESDKIDVGDLTPDQEKKITVPVFASLQPGLNLVSIKLEWKEDGEEKSDNIKLPLNIKSDASIGVYLEAKPSPLVKDTEHTLTVLVSNLGSYKINNVEIGLDSNYINIQDVQTIEYIGELENDDFSTVQFKIKPSKVGKQNITINVRYKDQSGKWENEKVVKEITIHDADNSNDNSLLFLSILVLVGLFGLWYFKFRQRK